MASYVEMSLDDIIKKKKKEKQSKPKLVGNQLTSRTFPKNPKTVPRNTKPSPKKNPITDARNKIISKKRVQIADARDKLAALAKQKDARLKLNKLRQERAQFAGNRLQALGQPGLGGRFFVQNHGSFVRTAPQPLARAFADPTRQVAYQKPGPARIPNKHPLNPKKFLETRIIGNKFSDKTDKMPRQITRTVENDIEVIDDPMGEEYFPPRPTLHNRKASMELKIIAHNDELESRSGISRRDAVVVRQKSPPRPPSILKKRPMAALRSEQVVPKIENPVLEYRIIVSNLRNTVTGGDIEELFGDIGGMVESRLVRPGTAEVIYKTQEDAQKAVDLYHNRQLDGQPMNCLLVTPRSPTAMQRNASKPALYSTNSNVEPDATTFLKVLFNNQ